jgi:hypothetical protein
MAAICLAAAALATAGCDQKMRYQPRYQAMDESHFEPFGDKRAARPLVEGTVPRGYLDGDSLLHTGKIEGKDSEVYPFTITKEVLERGRERFNIQCSPCHGRLGNGNGMIVQRGMVRPPDYTEDRLTTAPPGYIFGVISNGFGRMFRQDQIPVRDRWAIVAYVKTLQHSRTAKLEDVPEADRPKVAAGGAQ